MSESFRPSPEDLGVDVKDTRQVDLDRYRKVMENSEAGKPTVEYNTQTFETVFSRLLARSGSDPRVAGSVRDLLSELDILSRLGDGQEKFPDSRVAAITNLIGRAAEALRSQTIS